VTKAGVVVACRSTTPEASAATTHLQAILGRLACRDTAHRSALPLRESSSPPLGDAGLTLRACRKRKLACV
jgi:hypothetical protein